MLFHKHKIWFIGVPKTGTTSIHHTWRNKTDRDHDHYRVHDTLNSEDVELISSYYQFTIVRNPYDRMVSACHQHMRDANGDDEKDPNKIIQYLKGMDNDALHRFNEATTPQYLYLLDKPEEKGGQVAVKNIWRFERLLEQYKLFAYAYNKTAQFQIPNEMLHRNQSTERKKWYQVLNAESIALVNELYKKDFQLFGYDMLDPAKYTIRESQILDVI